MIPLSLFGRRAALAQQRQAAFHAGIAAIAPALVATSIWGLVTGVAMVKSGLAVHHALVMNLIVFAGTAQLAALPLIAASAPLWVILLTAAVINLRFVIFSAGLYPYFRRLPFGKRVALGYITSDLAFAIFLSRHAGQPDAQRGSTEQLWFFAGMAAANWVAWQLFSNAGILLATQIPGSWGLEFAGILALIALTVPMVNSRPAFVGAIVAGVVAVLGAGIPLRLGLVLAVVLGMVAAMLTELAAERRGPS